MLNAYPIVFMQGAAGGEGRPLTFFVQKEGDADFAKVVVPSSEADVADLKDEIVKKLGMTERLSAITLHLQTRKTIDGKDTTELGPALNSKLTLAKTGLVTGSDIMVKVSGTAATPPGKILLQGHTCREMSSTVEGVRSFL